MKNRRISKLTAFILMAAMIVSMFVMPGIPAQCATAKITYLDPNKVYTKLDVTGDGRADRFKIRCPKISEWTGQERPQFYEFSISVNGHTAYTHKDYKRPGFITMYPALITLGNGRKYLYITCGDGDTYYSSVTVLLQYKNGKYTKAVDLDQYCKPHAWNWDPQLASVKGNTINFDVYMYSFTGNGNFDGRLKMQFVYQNGTLKQNSTAARVEDCRITIGKNVWAYTDPSRTKNAFKLLAGDVVTADLCRISSTRMLLRVKKGTRYGWIVVGKGVIRL